MKLYSYWRSSAAYRVRIALNLKQIDCPQEFIHLVKDGGEQHSKAYKSKNPQALVPTLELNTGEILTQSLAIIEYLDESYEGPKLLPDQPSERAKIRAFAQTIACDIHPVNNLRILQYLTNDLQVNEKDKNEWYCHWIEQGFKALETQLASKEVSQFCFGEKPSLADICLIPQVYNAKRFSVNMDNFPMINKIDSHCLNLEAFAKAAPEMQQDATS